ncbi:conjugal transfer protein TraX [Yersinia mollaretii]|uniref:conjugal transfer protein TraX n=1 Tax=Yersinia mollaretii TaxID=33060 RepID=UPI0025AA437E|nr:conjugal transfer protein TraX [Yersinia mollaretii]MDN0112704.1 conjugal transfer protein TraX [Yersinia mollaretii]
MKKFTKATYHAANVLLPLSETARILRAMKYSGVKLGEQARRLKQAKDESTTELLSFDDAVRASGQTREVLISSHLRGKRIWLLLFVGAAMLALILPVAMILSGTLFSGILFSRTLSMSFMLAGFGGLMFIRALKNQYHLWQLQTRQLGTFAEWKATRNWLRDIFSWQLR